MQLQTTSAESKFPKEYTDAIFIQIDQHLKKLLPKYKGVPILWNTVYGTISIEYLSLDTQVPDKLPDQVPG